MQKMIEISFGLIGISAIAMSFFFVEKNNENAEPVSKDTLVVDVRTPGEFSGGHFPEALNIPLDSIQSRLSELGDKQSPIIVYCRSGARSSTALKILKKAGFKNVVNGGGLSQIMQRTRQTQ